MATITTSTTLTVPERPVTIGNWKGQGWIEEYSDGWSYAYIIDVDSPVGGQSPGGDTGGTPPSPRPPGAEPGPVGPTKPAGGTSCNDPVNISNGNVFEQVVDYTLRGPGAGTRPARVLLQLHRPCPLLAVSAGSMHL